MYYICLWGINPAYYLCATPWTLQILIFTTTFKLGHYSSCSLSSLLLSSPLLCSALSFLPSFLFILFVLLIQYYFWREAMSVESHLEQLCLGQDSICKDWFIVWSLSSCYFAPGIRKNEASPTEWCQKSESLTWALTYFVRWQGPEMSFLALCVQLTLVSVGSLYCIYFGALWTGRL